MQNIPNFQSLLKELKIDLDTRRKSGGDYRSLTGIFEKDQKYIHYLKDKPSPTEQELLLDCRPTLRKLHQSLLSENVARKDVAERLYTWVSERGSECDRGITGSTALA